MLTDSASDAEIQYGSQIGRFVIVGELGSGGMGVVYAAHDRELDRKVALKVLRGSVATDEDRTRMLREGQAMARITHANVITVYEVGLHGTLVFLAQELLDAGTLGKWLEKPHTQNEILNKFIRAGRGLAAAHAVGLVHRDFKPDNVLLGKDGRVRVADFGLARAVGSAGETRAMRRAQDPVTDPTRTPMSPLTATGAVMGTPMFMAPEQHLGERADARSDQFSFCVALYHALYGDYPFQGKTSVALADAVINGRIEPPPKGKHRGPADKSGKMKVPARLRKILLRGLSTRPEDRYPAMDALLADLLADPGRSTRRIAMIAGICVLVAGALVGGYAASRLREDKPEPPVVAPAKPPEIKTPSDDKPGDWLVAGIASGQFSDAIEKYDMAAAIKQQAGNKAQAATAMAAATIARVLRGQLADAEPRLHEIDANKGTDPTATAYADLAAAEIAGAHGELASARDHARACAAHFAASVPELAVMCHAVQGDAAAEGGDAAAARKAYEDGVALATQTKHADLAARLQLAALQLDLDDGKPEQAAARAMELQKAAIDAGDAIGEAEAQIMLARALRAQGETQLALGKLTAVKPAVLQPIRLRLEHAIALGATTALLGDTAGLEKLEAARAEADRQHYTTLVFAARLARVEVLVTTSAETAQTEQKELVEDARAHGLVRIAHLAEIVGTR